jgi:hypothetical protein
MRHGVLREGGVAKSNAKQKADPFKQRADETHLQYMARLADMKDRAAAAKQDLVTPEARANGQYEEGWTEIDGQRARVMINRGGSTIARWMNMPADDVMGDAERAAIRYCQMLWARLDYRRPPMVVVDNGRDGESEAEALAELSAIKIKLPIRYWNLFENICRFELNAGSRHDRVTVGFVAGMIALWRGL